MKSTRTIAVVGATGTQGGSVARAILKTPQLVLAETRDRRLFNELHLPPSAAFASHPNFVAMATCSRLTPSFFKALPVTSSLAPRE